MLDDLFGLTGKTALITGGGSGIGAMMAQGFAQAGARVIICSRKLHQVEETAAEINATNPSGSVKLSTSDSADNTNAIPSLGFYAMILLILSVLTIARAQFIRP